MKAWILVISFLLFIHGKHTRSSNFKISANSLVSQVTSARNGVEISFASKRFFVSRSSRYPPSYLTETDKSKASWILVSCESAIHQILIKARVSISIGLKWVSLYNSSISHSEGLNLIEASIAVTLMHFCLRDLNTIFISSQSCESSQSYESILRNRQISSFNH